MKAILAAVLVFAVTVSQGASPSGGVSPAPRWVDIVPLLKDTADPVLVADLARLEKETVVDSVAYNCTLVPEGLPPTDKAAIYARRFRALRSEVKKVSPIKQGFLFQATIGHGWKPNSETPWQKIVTADDKWKPYKFCPIGKEFLAYIAKAAKTLAAEKPDFFMVDDDTRLITGIEGCYCPEHLAEFARRTGKARTREQVVADCKADPALQAAWDELRYDSIAILLKTIREQFPTETPGMFCCCNLDAHHAGRLARVLAAPGQRPSVRLNNAWYCNHSMIDLPRILSMTAREINDIGEGVDILDEMDTCPQNRYATSATRMIDHAAMAAFEGCVGGKIWVSRLGNAHETRSGEYYRTLLARQKGFLEAVSGLGVARTGVVIPLPAKRPLGWPLSYSPNDWGSSFFGYMGLPYRYARPVKGDVVALAGFDLRYFSDAELTNLLSGTVLVDGDAAIRLTARGFGKLIGVEATDWNGATISAEDFGDESLKGTVLWAADLTKRADGAEELSRYLHARSGLSPADEYLAPGSIRYRNALGGTVVTIAAKLVMRPDNLCNFWYFNETRKRQMTKILRSLAGGRVPGGVFYAGDAPAVCLNGTARDGSSVFVIDTIGADTIERPEMIFEAGIPPAVERLDDAGAWRSVGFKSEKGEIRLDSPVESFRPAVFRIPRLSAAVSGVADFGGEAVPLRRLNGMCNTVAMTGNLYPSRTNRVETLLKALEIPETRFHDVVLENPGIQLVDVSRIFPLFHADENDPKNYDFRPTDLYLARARELGGELEFRFGEQIEHQGEQFQVRPPADIAKWARICLNIARHYNEGWGDGYRWNIRRFSVWEEPDNDQLFYRSTKGNYEQCYFKMYAAVARLLKDRFPGVQVGGPNTMTMGYCPKFRSFVDYCEKEKLPLDFAAFTTYPRTPEGMFGPVRAARKYLDEHGFGKTELELSEWHYGPSDWSLNFKDIVRWEKELTGPEAVAFTAAALIAGQDEPIDRMFYYAMYVSDWGVFKRGGWPRPMYYAFRDFAEAAHDAGRVPCPLNPAPGWYALATRRTDGTGRLLVSAFGRQNDHLALELKGVEPVSATVVAMEGEPKAFTDFTFANGVLTVKRPLENAVMLFTCRAKEIQ